MSRPHTVLDLSDYVKLARELAILGNYEKSLSKYKTALNIVKDRKDQVVDQSLKDKWNNVFNLIKNEILMVHEVFKVASDFRNSDETRLARAKEEEERNNQILMRDYNPPDNNLGGFNNNQNDDFDPRWKHFHGKKPFQVWKDGSADELKRPNKDYKDYNRNKPNNNNYNNNKANVGGKGRPVSKQAPGAVGKKGAAAPNSKGGKDGEKDPREGKSAFFLSHYPDGEGPDAELIEMIERDMLERAPNVQFDQIADLEVAKNALKEAVLLPLLMPDFFRGLRRPWKGVLLYGPPGTGKTLLAKALATQGKTTFFNVSPTTFASKWKGESEKLVRLLFEMARFYAPSTIFIDEVDSIGQKRGEGDNEASRKVMAEMLVQMDGVSGKVDEEGLSIEELKKNIVMVLGATNLPWDLDEALRRRFEKRIYIPLPTSVGRREMLSINLKGMNVSNDIDYDKIVKMTEGYSGADIASVCREASYVQMRSKLMKTGARLDLTAIKQDPTKLERELDAPISMEDFMVAIRNVSKSVKADDLKKYDAFTEEYSSK